MSVSSERPDDPTDGELLAVAEAAGSRLRADTEEDSAAAAAAAAALLEAATSAMGAGRSLSEITTAEARGKENVRRALRSDVLKHVERNARQAREADTEHHRAIAQAMRLGLSTREIAAAAGLTHSTIRAITNRLAAQSESSPAAPQ